MVETNYTLDVAFSELTKEMDIAIGREVQKFNNLLIQKSRDVWDTGHFFRSWKAPLQNGYDWTIINTADYSPVLARGRRTINGRAYGSLNWANGLDPMLAKLKVDIINATDKIKV